MSAPRLKVVLTRRLPDAVETRMRELFDAELNLTDAPMDQAALEAAVRRADVLVPTITDAVDAGLIAAAGPQLRMIANFGAGVDHIDVEAAVAKGLIVTNTPGVLTEDTADLAMALILAVSRRIVEGAQVVAEGRFEGWTPTWMMQVHYHNRKPVPAMIAEELGATYWDDLDQMLARMDIISLNCPATRETHHLLSAERLARLQPHALLINTARGELIDEAALADAVARRALAGVGLDVYEHEPAVHPGLLGHANVVLLPHLGSATIEARQDMGERVIANILTFQNGHRPPDRVIPAML